MQECGVEIRPPRLEEVKPIAPQDAGARESLARVLWGEAGPASRRWYVLHTLPRQEKALGEGLDALGLRYYLPLLRKVTFYGHRRREALLPMFPSYLFLWGERDETFAAVETRRVARVLDVAGQGELDFELLQVRRTVEAFGSVEPYRYLTEGRRVRVVSGPMKGVEGLVESLERADRLILRVSALGQAVAVETHASLVEPID